MIHLSELLPQTENLSDMTFSCELIFEVQAGCIGKNVKHGPEPLTLGNVVLLLTALR